MFLIAELPEFTEIRLIYQTKKSLAVFEMAYLLTVYCPVHGVYCLQFFLKNTVWNSIQYTTYVSE